ncbi:PREDICTED: uncharacterized protein LOC109372854 [Hipposideros armiger]|uniref:Uncharacterized protein LOC109372854 n=1 Tax=Hipposideros armiger TaxID=186990 RepID=A0A8B7PZC9_HIPAR|nr:PREDICTED: uncharacterized protein LOC109372854 [Hipposideros armiger]
MAPRPSCVPQPDGPGAHGTPGPSRPGRAEGVDAAPPAAPPAVTRRHPLHLAGAPPPAPRPRESPHPRRRSPASAPHWGAERRASGRGPGRRRDQARCACALARRELFLAFQSPPVCTWERFCPFLTQADSAERADAITRCPAQGCGYRTASWTGAWSLSTAPATPARPRPVTPGPGAKHRAEAQDHCRREHRCGLWKIRKFDAMASSMRMRWTRRC